MAIAGNKFSEDKTDKLPTSEAQEVFQIKKENNDLFFNQGDFVPTYPWEIPAWVIRERNSFL